MVRSQHVSPDCEGLTQQRLRSVEVVPFAEEEGEVVQAGGEIGVRLAEPRVGSPAPRRSNGSAPSRSRRPQQEGQTASPVA